MLFTNKQIEEIATLESVHAAARVTLQARHSNEREELLANQDAERKALADRLGLSKPKAPPAAAAPAKEAKRRR